jgi:hypothetical protein
MIEKLAYLQIGIYNICSGRFKKYDDMKQKFSLL